MRLSARRVGVRLVEGSCRRKGERSCECTGSKECWRIGAGRVYCTTHFAVGAMLGSITPGQGAAALGGLVSHAALDAIPHSDYSRTAQGVFDVTVTCFLVAFTARAGYGPQVLWGGIAAVLPDLEVAMDHLFPRAYRPHGRLRLVFPSHSGLVRHARLPFPWGAFTQVLVLVIGAAALYLRALF
ncbi:MAG: hypothetical protein AB1774_01175 [Bacillota bacterium]